MYRLPRAGTDRARCSCSGRSKATVGKSQVFIKPLAVDQSFQVTTSVELKDLEQRKKSAKC